MDFCFGWTEIILQNQKWKLSFEFRITNTSEPHQQRAYKEYLSKASGNEKFKYF